MNISVNEEIKSRSIIQQRHQQLKISKPGIRARDAAQILDLSECELLASRLGDGVTRLLDDAETILKQLLLLGEVMALTRNNECVHERTGIYNNPSFFNQGEIAMGLFVNSDIDLRLFMSHWAFCFSCVEPSMNGLRKSIQFFDKAGEAVHKVYLIPESNEYAYDLLVKQFQHVQQDDMIRVERYTAKTPDKSDSEIDWTGFRAAWEGLQDTHEFLPMLRKFKVGREQGFRNIGTDFARRVANDSISRALEMVRDRHCEIMVFVGNRGCIQIHTGPVENLKHSAGWFNVLDPMFNLHLNTESIASIWVTHKPTSDGIVSALELFNEDGESIATLFGKRKPGEPELPVWRDILTALPTWGESNVA